MKKKSEARKFARSALEGLQNKKQVEESIVATLLENYSDLSSAFVYSALPSELSIGEYFRKNSKTRFYFPRITSISEREMEFVSPRGWKRGPYGIFEPLGDEILSCELVDLVFLPCLAVNLRGFRLGHGGGFYDNFFSHCPRTKLFAISFSEVFPLDFQEEAHDIKMSGVITEKGMIFIEN